MTRRFGLWALLCAVASFLFGCGGGGGSQAVAVAPIVIRPDLWFAFFGSGGLQIANTAPFTNMLFLMGWGDWSTPAGREAIGDRIVNQMNQGVLAGVTQMTVAVDFLIFDPQFRFRGLNDLVDFIARLKSVHLWQYVSALYPLDEPDLHVNDATMSEICAALRMFSKPLAVIYGSNHYYPGISQYDWVGMDHYGSDVLSQDYPDLIAHMKSTQRLMVVPGGADPWREDPQPFLDYASRNPQVIGIVAFLYVDNWGGTTNKGIGSNGMLPQYAAIGKLVKAE